MKYATSVQKNSSVKKKYQSMNSNASSKLSHASTRNHLHAMSLSDVSFSKENSKNHANANANANASLIDREGAATAAAKTEEAENMKAITSAIEGAEIWSVGESVGMPSVIEGAEKSIEIEGVERNVPRVNDLFAKERTPPLPSTPKEEDEQERERAAATACEAAANDDAWVETSSSDLLVFDQWESKKLK